MKYKKVSYKMVERMLNVSNPPRSENDVGGDLSDVKFCMMITNTTGQVYRIAAYNRCTGIAWGLVSSLEDAWEEFHLGDILDKKDRTNEILSFPAPRTLKEINVILQEG